MAWGIPIHVSVEDQAWFDVDAGHVPSRVLEIGHRDPGYRPVPDEDGFVPAFVSPPTRHAV